MKPKRKLKINANEQENTSYRQVHKRSRKNPRKVTNDQEFLSDRVNAEQLYDNLYGMPGKYENGCGGGRQRPSSNLDKIDRSFGYDDASDDGEE